MLCCGRYPPQCYASCTVDYASSAWACSAIFVSDPTTVNALPTPSEVRAAQKRDQALLRLITHHQFIHRRPSSNQPWLSVMTTQRCGRTSVSRQLTPLSRRYCNSLCSTVSIALPTRESRLIWHSSSVPTGDKVSERTSPDGQSRVKLVKKLWCTNSPKHYSSDCRHRPSDSVI